MGESVTEGIIGKWLKQVGDRVEKYDSLVEVFTDKVNMEMPSPVSGTLTAVLVSEGDTVPMGSVIADIRVEGEEEAASLEAVPEARAVGPEDHAMDRTGELLKDVAPLGPTGSGGPNQSAGQDVAAQRRVGRYSPAVQRLAEEHGADLSQITGTGIGGRVTRRDVQSYIESMQGQVHQPRPRRHL